MSLKLWPPHVTSACTGVRGLKPSPAQEIPSRLFKTSLWWKAQWFMSHPISELAVWKSILPESSHWQTSILPRKEIVLVNGYGPTTANRLQNSKIPSLRMNIHVREFER